jgi:hypothetical protein
MRTMNVVMVICLVIAIVPVGALIVGAIETLDEWLEDRE